MDRAALEQMLGEGLSLAEIGRRLDRHESTVSYWLARYGLHANGRKHAARGGLDRDELAELVEREMSIAEIATALNRSKATVRHWLGKHGLRTSRARGRRRVEETERAKEAGLTEAIMVCVSHGETKFVLDRGGYYRCRLCRSAAVSRRRRRLKEQLVAEAGGACRICGYARHLGALEFHHVVPEEKRFSLSGEGVTRSLARAREEASKCVLLCSNCHVEVEAGVIAVPGLGVASLE
jgi:transposase